MIRILCIFFVFIHLDLRVKLLRFYNAMIFGIYIIIYRQGRVRSSYCVVKIDDNVVNIINFYTSQHYSVFYSFF